MSVQGGGGGKKIPPGGPPVGGAARPAKAPSTPPKAAEAQPTKTPPRTDSFEAHRFKSTTGELHRLDEAFAHAATPSGIDSLIRLLDASRAQLAGEHRALRAQSQAIIERLVQSGFAAPQLEAARRELLELRKKMAALRRRLQHLQRRLKSAYASAGKTGDANFARLLGAQLERLRKLGPGLARALLALQTIEQAYASFADGSVPVLRLDVASTAPDARGLVGRSLGGVAPGAAVAQATLALLRDGPDGELPGPDARFDDDAPRAQVAALDGTRALAEALLPSPAASAGRPPRPTK